MNKFCFRNISKEGRTALMLASENGHTDAVNIFLAIPDIDINIQDNVRKQFMIDC